MHLSTEEPVGSWKCLEKLAEMFLNIFHRISFSKDTVKRYREKIVLNTLQLEFSVSSPVPSELRAFLGISI